MSVGTKGNENDAIVGVVRRSVEAEPTKGNSSNGAIVGVVRRPVETVPTKGNSLVIEDRFEVASGVSG